MPVPLPASEGSTRAHLHRHYEIERALAEKLRRASKEARPELYSEVYDELFRRVPELRQEATDPQTQAHVVNLQVQLLSSFLGPGSIFLEIGGGDSALALRLAETVGHVFSIDASPAASTDPQFPDNFELIRSDATALDLNDSSVDLAYSCHFLEHLHPEDAFDHAVEVRRVLRVGGSYVSVTPNRLWGPHDISRFFDDVPSGLHLREYSHAELVKVFQDAGFDRVEVLSGIGQQPRCTSARPYRVIEGLFDRLPLRWRRPLLSALLGRFREAPFRPLEQVKLIARRET